MHLTKMDLKRRFHLNNLKFRKPLEIIKYELKIKDLYIKKLNSDAMKSLFDN